MSSLQNVSAEELAKLFHHYQEALACDFDCRRASTEAAPSWEETPPNERKLKVAAVRLALLELTETQQETKSAQDYFAKPGEADWGC